jgi:hypothetical protein
MLSIAPVLFGLYVSTTGNWALAARQRRENTRQRLCRAFFQETHGKDHTAAICTVKAVCCAFFIARTTKNLCHASNVAHGKKKWLAVPLLTVV